MRFIVVDNAKSINLNMKNLSNSFYIFLLIVNFKNITVRLHDFYVLNMHVEFCLNRMLFIIRSIKNIYI